MKRSPGLRALSSEHHTALVLARRALAVSRGEVAETWRDLVQRFERELEPHFRQEEEQLLPALAQAGEKALVQRTLDEHTQLRSLIYHQSHDADTLQAFAELLQSHVRFEERVLFVTAQERLPEFIVETPD